MAKARNFTTLPARAIRDGRLSALDIRAIAAIALHDGMSLRKGKGPGCYAKASTLAEWLAVDITSFSRTLSKLIKLGYILREPQQNDKRRFTLRVIYDGEDTCHPGQLSSDDLTDETVDETANHRPDLVDRNANFPVEIVDMSGRKNSGFSSKTDPHYISLNEEVNSVETEKLNSVETAQRAVAAGDLNDFVRDVSGNLKVDTNGESRRKKDRAEASARQGVSIRNLLPKDFLDLKPGAQLQRFERALKTVEGKAVNPEEAHEYGSWLYATLDAYAGDQTLGPWAQRLYENLPWEIAA